MTVVKKVCSGYTNKEGNARDNLVQGVQTEARHWGGPTVNMQHVQGL